MSDFEGKPLRSSHEKDYDDYCFKKNEKTHWKNFIGRKVCCYGYAFNTGETYKLFNGEEAWVDGFCVPLELKKEVILLAVYLKKSLKNSSERWLFHPRQLSIAER